MNARQPNIILITVDSLRADHLGCYGYTRPTSPNIDHLASDSFLFTHAFSSGPNTPHAFPAIMACRNSLMAKRLGLFDAPLTLAEFLQSTKYATIAFNAANPYISRFFHYDRGFDEFHDYLDFTIPTKKSKTAATEFINSPNASKLDNEPSLNITLPDLDLEHYLISEENIRRKACLESEMNSDIFERLQRVAGQAFFLWIHYMDTHYPYLPQLIPQQELGIRPISKEENFQINTRIRENMKLAPEMLHRALELYDAAIRQLDSKLGELFYFLKALDLYDSSLLIVTADHGEEFLEHADLQHKSKLFDELIHVPLLIKLPYSHQKERRHELISLIQLAPTIATSPGVENPFEHKTIFRKVSDGQEAGAKEIFAEASYSNNGTTPVDAQMSNIFTLPKIYCCRERQWKLIVDKGKNEHYLFNLITDPNETQDVYYKEKAQVLRLQKKLEGHINTLENCRLTAQINRLRQKISSNQNAVMP